MSEIWNNNSEIEEKKSFIATPQASQLRTKFNIREIYDIIREYRNNGKIEENDYHNLCLFVDSEYAEQYDELTNYVKDLFGDELKKEYFKMKLVDSKEKIKNYEYETIYNYFINNEINQKDIDSFKYFLYQAMKKIPELFNDSMLSKKYKEKIVQILSENEIIQRNKIDSELKYCKNEIDDFIYQKKIIDDTFKSEIVKEMPQDYTNLEKSIYIYIKLCQSLSYDPNYYAKKDNYKEKHQKFENISKIGIETNNVICYEFVTIYSDLLKDMGLNVATTTKFDMNLDKDRNIVFTNFSDDHSNLTYSVDDIIIFADSTTSVLGGDMINAKMNNPLNGLQCLNVEQSKKDKFSNALNKVYSNLIIENSIFKKYEKDIKEKPLVEKLKLLFNDLNGIDFNSTDFISYIASIKHELFTENELDWNLKISYIGKNKEDSQYPVALFSVNTNDIKNVEQDTSQYLYDGTIKNVVKLDKEELDKMFEDGELFFIDGSMHIPNVHTIQTGLRNR